MHTLALPIIQYTHATFVSCAAAVPRRAVPHPACLTRRAQRGQCFCTAHGYGHEVITLEGQVYAGTDTALAVNWVSWCLPKHLANASVMAMLAGITKEDQRTVQRALSKPQRAQMLAIARAWASKQ